MEEQEAAAHIVHRQLPAAHRECVCLRAVRAIRLHAGGERPTTFIKGNRAEQDFTKLLADQVDVRIQGFQMR